MPPDTQSPIHRPRRLRQSAGIRELVRETSLEPRDFILPLFVSERVTERRAIASMPGVSQLPLGEVAREAAAAAAAGVRAVLLFGIPLEKDERASQAHAESGVVQRAVRAIKAEVPELTVITDVCLCEYMSHGHCGIVEEGRVLNDESLDLLARTAVSHAQAGADIVAPSDMMDGRVAAIRAALEAAGHRDTIIMSYAAKFASALYGPFRDAAESAPAFGDRRTYQMDAANAREAMREVALDVAESADIILIKPALTCLDLVWRVKERFQLPTAVYCVSGEYAMLEAAAANGWIDRRAAVLECMLSCKRAGADLIVTYWAREIAGWLKA